MELRNTYDIPKYNFPILEKKFKRLVKRANKINVKAPSFEINHSYLKEVEFSDDVFSKIEFLNITVVGETPKYAGWSFISLIVNESDGTRIVRNIPGESVPLEYLEKDNICEHCNTRRNRKKLFIIRHDSGDIKQIGSTCVKDFIGGDDPNAVASMCESFINLTEEFGNVSFGNIPRSERFFPVRNVLVITNAMIRVYGWIPKSKAVDRSSTSEDVVDFLFSTKKDNNIEVVDSDFEKADLAIKWCLDLESKESVNNYEYNIIKIAKNEDIGVSNFGFACSIISAYENFILRNIKKEDFSSSVHVGEIKERITFNNVRILFVKHGENDYGATTLIKMVTEDGNILTWFASKYIEIEKDTIVNIKGTVKKHTIFNNINETVLTRVAFINKVG